MSLKGKTSIFSPPEVATPVKQMQLISDRALIRDLQDPEMIGSIVIPEKARERGLNNDGTLRLGVVVATGPGDRFIEMGITDEEEVRRKLIERKCPYCTGEPFNVCGVCDGSGKIPVLIPPQCKIGDTVIYSRRREAEFYRNGVRYSLVHAEQSVIAVVE